MTTPTPEESPNNNTRSPARNAPGTGARPGVVTAASVLGLIWGILTIISSLVSMVAGSILRSVGSACAPNDQSGLCAFADDSTALLIIIGSALIVAAAMVIWGSAAARSGKNATTLVIASAIQIVIQLVWMIATGSVAFGIVGVIVPLLIIGLVSSTPSKAWFRGSTHAAG